MAMVELIFLAVMIIALLIGNVLLFVIPKKKPPVSVSANAVPLQQAIVSGQNEAVKNIVFEERIDLLNTRVASLEAKASESGNRHFAIESEIVRKVLGLEEFKRNSHIEIEALKQRIDNMRRELNLPSDAKKKIEVNVPEERLRALAFNTH